MKLLDTEDTFQPMQKSQESIPKWMKYQLISSVQGNVKFFYPVISIQIWYNTLTIVLFYV